MNTELMFSSKSDNWETPQYLYDELDSEFHFTLDPCADDQNHKCGRYFTKEQDGLKQEWTGVVFCNPPYGREVGRWVEKAYNSARGGVHGCTADICQNRHEIFPRVHIPQSGDQVYQRACKIRRIKKPGSVSVNGLYI